MKLVRKKSPYNYRGIAMRSLIGRRKIAELQENKQTENGTKFERSLLTQLMSQLQNNEHQTEGDDISRYRKRKFFRPKIILKVDKKILESDAIKM